MIFLKYIENTSSGFGLKDYVSFSAFMLALGTFIYDRYWASRLRRVDAERNWYLKVLIEPNLEKINAFFEIIDSTFKENIIKLTSSINVQDANSIKLFHNEKFTDEKRILEGKLIFPIRIPYPLLSIAVEQVFSNLYDDYTSALDENPLKMNAAQDFHIISQQSKANLLALLYQPLSRNRQIDLVEHIQ